MKLSLLFSDCRVFITYKWNMMKSSDCTTNHDIVFTGDAYMKIPRK